MRLLTYIISVMVIIMAVFDSLSLEQFKDIVKTFIEDYGNKKA